MQIYPNTHRKFRKTSIQGTKKKELKATMRSRYIRIEYKSLNLVEKSVSYVNIILEKNIDSKLIVLYKLLVHAFYFRSSNNVTDIN